MSIDLYSDFYELPCPVCTSNMEVEEDRQYLVWQCSNCAFSLRGTRKVAKLSLRQVAAQEAAEEEAGEE